MSDLAAAFWSSFGLPLIQLALIVTLQSASAPSSAVLKGLSAALTLPKPAFETPPLNALVASTSPDAAVPSPPIAATAAVVVASMFIGSPITRLPSRQTTR